MNAQELFSLRGRVALVTGGSRGLGRMIAMGFLQQGAKVYISSRKKDACDQAAIELSAYGECISLPADLSTTEGVKGLAASLSQREPELHVLVNNAGAAWEATFDDFPELGWDKVLNLDLKAPFFLTHALAALLRRAAQKGRPSKVINIASIDGVSINPRESYSYSGAKAGLVHLTRHMAQRLIKDHIVVSAVSPGEFPSDMNRDARDKPDLTAARIPAGRLGEPEDLAAAAIYLASRAGDYLVGSNIVVDGGVSWSRA